MRWWRWGIATVLAVVLLAAGGTGWWSARWFASCDGPVAGVPCRYRVLPPAGPLPADRGVGSGGYVYGSTALSFASCHRCLVTADGRRYRLRGWTADGDLGEELSPDGHWLSQPDEDGTSVRELTGTTVRRLPGVTVRAWSPDSRYLLAPGSGPADPGFRYVRVDLATGAEVEYVAPPAVDVIGIRESGAILTTDSRTGVRSVDPVDGRVLDRTGIDLPGDLDPLHALTVSPDGRRGVAVTRVAHRTGATDLVVLQLDLSTGRVLHRTDLPASFVLTRLLGTGVLVQEGGGDLLLLDPGTGRYRVAARVPPDSYVIPPGTNTF
jgi:hypothetical protein